MKRKLLSSLAVLAVVLTALALTGCGSKDSGSSDQNMPAHQHSH